jgi:BirA family biotin operon repressor/biotin-[acetyl-CoA-carboxylase] ligase
MAYEGLEGTALEGRWQVPRCEVHERVTSTLDVLRELAEDGAAPGTTVLADEQVAGRGRQGRRWYSPPGRGAWIGYLMRPEDPSAVALVALRVGLAAADALEVLGASVALKWPNDLILANRKLGGILCEARWRGARPAWVAVGVGLNVHGPMPGDLRDSAIALDEVCPRVGRLDVLDRVIPALARIPGTPRLEDAELRAYARRDWLRGRRILEPAAGYAVGIDDGGALLVEADGGGVERINGGSIVAA